MIVDLQDLYPSDNLPTRLTKFFSFTYYFYVTAQEQFEHAITYGSFDESLNYH